MEKEPTRRTSLKVLAGLTWAGLVGAAGLGLGAVFRLAGAGSAAAASQPVDFGSVPDWKDGQVLVMERAALCRDSRGWFALDLTCPHLGCKPGWNAEQKRFLCPCHGSAFAADGGLLQGPAKEGLAHLELTREPDGRLLAHPGRPVPADRRLPA